MTTTSPAISNSTDLVLQLAGGDRNGHLLPVSTAKCLLSSLIVDKVEAEKYRCAIFRGEKGVAFRSYSELVLVNGNKTSVQWLKEGDTIQLTPELKVVVKHLGTFVPSKAPKAPLPATRQAENTISMAPATDHGAPASGKAINEASANSKPADSPVTDNPVTQIMPTADHNVGQRMEVLSDQLTSLVDVASDSGAVTAAAELTNQTAPETPADEPLSDKKMADASSSIQEYLDKALASPSTSAIASPNPMPQSPEAAPAKPADFAAGTSEPRRTAATLDFEANSDASPASSSPENAAKLREEAVSSSVNRLLAGTDGSPVGQDLRAEPTAVTPQDQQPSATTKSDSVLLPNPSQPTTLESSQVVAADAQSPIAPPVAPTPVAMQSAAPESVEATASVDAPKAQSMEFLKSLGIDTKELGLGNTTPTPENTTPSLTQPAPDAPRDNTPSAVLPTADDIIASASMGSALSADALSSEEEAPEPVAAPAKAESVADVLARMQNAGSLENFSMDGPAEEASPEPVSVPTEVAPPKPEVSETVVADSSTESQSAGDEDGSVEDYMSQLLTRMRGGVDSEVTEDKESDDEKSAPAKEVSEETEVVETSAAELPQETLTAEQFVPKEKAVRMKSFDSLREIANNSNRSAIQDHLANQRKISTQTKMQLALISLGFGVLFFLMSWVFSAKVSVGGVFCGIAFLTAGVVFAKFYRDEQKLDESIIKAQNAKA